LAPNQVVIESIDLLPSPPPVPRVTIFLFNIQENPFLKNRDGVVTPVGAGAVQLRPPPLVLDLHFLICAWAQNTTDEHVILGSIARALYDKAEFDANELNRDPLVSGFQPDESVQVVLANMSIEDQARIWTSFGFQRFKLSLYYLARIVPIASNRVFAEGTVR